MKDNVDDVGNKVVEQAASRLCGPFSIFEDHLTHTQKSGSAGPCKASLLRMGAYSLQLTKDGLLPLSYWNLGSRTIVQKISSVEPELKTQVSNIARCTSDCAYCDFEWDSTIARAARVAKDSVDSLCLSCVKEDRFRPFSYGCTSHHV